MWCLPPVRVGYPVVMQHQMEALIMRVMAVQVGHEVALASISATWSWYLGTLSRCPWAIWMTVRHTEKMTTHCT